MRRVLVTGGAGFIGSHLVDALVARGDQVRVLDDFSTGKSAYLAAVASRIELARGDVGDAATVRRAMDGVTHVLHLAAMRAIQRSIENPALCHRINVDGTLHVLIAARDAKVRRVVLASSCAVYGDAAVLPTDEEQPAHPGSPYAVSKLAAEWYLRMFRSLYGLDTVCLRYFNVFGPRMDASSGYAMAVPRFSACLLRDEPPPVYGDGKQSRDFIYIDNIVRGTLQAMDADAVDPGVFNLAGGRDYSVLEIIGMLNAILHKQIAPKHLPPMAGEARRVVADIRRAQRALGFAPAVSVEDGLARTVNWFRNSS